jgi:hypothetical protein
MLQIPAETLAIQTAHRATFDRLYAGDHVAPLPAICGAYLGYYGPAEDDALAAWCAETLPGVVDEIVAKAANPRAFYPLVLEFAPLGVHFVDALFGARVFHTEHTVWSDELPGSLADQPALDVAAHPLVSWMQRATATLLAQLPAPIAVTTPIFSSPLNVTLNLFGERALVDLADPDPDTLRGLDRITAAIADLHRLMRRWFPERVRFYCSSTRFAPDGVGHLCGCSTQLVSAATYAGHFAPRDAAVLTVYSGGGTLHLCGHHTQHLAAWRAMPALRAVQLNDAASDEFPAYFAGLRDDQLIYLSPTDTMPLSRIMAVSGGRRVIYQGEIAATACAPGRSR